MEDEYEDDYYDEGEIIDNTVRKPVLVRDDEEYDDSYDVKPRRQSQKVTPIRPVRKAPGNNMEVCVIKPSSSTYAISGNLQKISNYIFIITPACVDISGDFQEIFSGSFDVPPISHNAV